MKNVTYEIQGKFITFFVDGVKTTTVTSDNVEECIKNYIEIVNYVPTENESIEL